MNVSDLTSAYSIFDYASLRQSGMEQLAQSALSSGITYYQNGDYKAAAQEFQRSIAMSPYSDNIVDTWDYLASTYLQLDDEKNAEKAYKMALSLDPLNDEIYTKLGNLYYAQEKFDGAEAAYQSAVNVSPSATTYYSLAHCCLGTGQLGKAEHLFEKVISLEPDFGNGQYGLGMVYGKQGKYDAAIQMFEEAVDLNPDLDDARAEMGYVLADAGRNDEAMEQVELLEESNKSLAGLLYTYAYEVKKPEFSDASQGTFNWNLSIRSSVVALNNYLKNAGETKYFTVYFDFNKDMDTESVQNIYNWNMGRAEGYGPQAYNFGLSILDNEVDLPKYPTSVLYDPGERTAAVTFAITQNEYADGIIDPSHIEFSFSGTDRFGLTMNPDADTYSKFNGFS